MSWRKEKLLVVEPEKELVFYGPFEEGASARLALTNPQQESDVFFKVKTTEPEAFCVRPKSGIVSKGETLFLSVRLKGGHYKPHTEKPIKFKIQAIKAPKMGEDPAGFLERQDNVDISESKIKCVFVEVSDNEKDETLRSGVSSELCRLPRGGSSSNAQTTDLVVPSQSRKSSLFLTLAAITALTAFVCFKYFGDQEFLPLLFNQSTE